MTLTHGGLFEGYGGTSIAAAMTLGPLDTRWYSDIKPAACALLAHHARPDIPNLGDLTAIDFREVERVDVLTASWPCQPHSSAGKRLGEEDPRALWPHVLRAIAVVRPRVFLGENVARIASNGELERVARTLAAIGYVGAYRLHRADWVGAPHRRDRAFVVAIDATDPGAADLVAGLLADRGAGAGAGVPGERVTLLPTPTQSMTTGPGASGRDGGLNLQTAATRLPLLPTPSASTYGTNQGGAAGRTGPVRESLDTMARKGRLLPAPRESDGPKGGPGQRGSSGDLMLPSAVVSLLPTPTVTDSKGGRNATAGRSEGAEFHSGWTLSDVAYAERFGEYAPAVEAWARALGRPAPDPTQRSETTGKPQLSPRFVEWMMGLPDGHVTGTGVQLSPSGRPASERNAMLSLLGDGVVPQQAAAAFRLALVDVLGVPDRHVA